MSDRQKELIRIAIIDTVICIALVICYSPGLLGLRPSDASILRAGLSILIVPISGIIFYMTNASVFAQKSVKTFDGKRVTVKITDSEILEDIDRYNNQIQDVRVTEKSLRCRSCLADVFAQANDEDNDYTVPVVRSKLEYYLDVYTDTLKRMVTLEKYSNTSLYKQSYKEISDTLDLLQEVFLKALDQMLSNTLNGAELDKIVLKNMMAMDGYGHNPFEELKDKYS